MFGKLVYEARTKAGLTQEQLAARARLTREYVSLLELDKRKPTIFIFIRLTRALGLSPAELIGQVEKLYPQEVALAEYAVKVFEKKRNPTKPKR